MIMTGTPYRPYQQILLVVDLSADSLKIGARARLLAAASGATITILHVVEWLAAEPLGESLLQNATIETALIDAAHQKLTSLAHTLGLTSSPLRVESGAIQYEIVRVARDIAADLIVIGGHERHGLAALFNRTEDTVRHASPCDVLVVRLP